MRRPIASISERELDGAELHERFGLKRSPPLADLAEEESPGMGLFEEAPVCPRMVARERSFAIAEELALEETCEDRSAVVYRNPCCVRRESVRTRCSTVLRLQCS